MVFSARGLNLHREYIKGDLFSTKSLLKNRMTAQVLHTFLHQLYTTGGVLGSELCVYVG